MATSVVQAAGGVVRRETHPDRLQVLLIHRPRHDDWSLPKGKLDPGEGWEQAALREVEEETGLRCRLVRPLGETRYPDAKGRPKVVRYWLMDLADGETGEGFTPNREVDEVRWCAPAEATQLLSYDHDRTLVGQAAAE